MVHLRLQSLCGVLVAVAVWAAAAMPLAAQSSAVTLRVRVLDAQRLPVPGAACVATSGLRPPVQGVSDGEGLATLSVAPGVYVVRVQLDGFRAFESGPVRAPAGEARVDVVATLEAAATDSVTVSATAASSTDPAAGAAPPAGLASVVLKRLPIDLASPKDALPLVPGVVRSATGEISLKGASEEQSAFLLNGLSATDPATGGFRLALPVDAVEEVQVFIHPYTAEYGQFTGGLTQLETRAGADRWHAEINDFLPDLRFVRRRVVGIAEDTPHLNVNGPIVRGRLLLSQSASYQIQKRPVRGLEFPHNETRVEAQSYFTQLDATLVPGHRQTATFGFFPARHDFVGLDVFRPQPVTPSARQRDLVVTLRDQSTIGRALLSSAVSFTQFNTAVWAQGSAPLRLTPRGEEGNFFASQDRHAQRLEMFELFAVPSFHWAGRHDVKFGLDAKLKGESLHYEARPIEIVRANGTLARRIDFEPAAAIRAHNDEYVGFVQDRWSLSPSATIDLGLRYEDQRIADAVVAAPRAGFAWSPGGGSTVVRGGAGFFYGALPLNLRAFAQYPRRTVTRYAPDGTVVSAVQLTNLLVGADTPARVAPGPPAEQSALVPGNFTWNLEVDRAFGPRLALRANLLSSATRHVYIVDREADAERRGYLALRSNGRADYRALELTGRIGPPAHAMTLSYTLSRSLADLNEFGAVLGDFASPVVYPNQYSRTAADVPHRFIAWGGIPLPRRFTVAPVLELRSGFPYTVLREDQSLGGLRNADATRFPTFFALDVEASKDLRLKGRYDVRLSLRSFNVTNHFNPRDVRANLADPGFGTFLASYRRYVTGGFDVLF